MYISTTSQENIRIWKTKLVNINKNYEERNFSLFLNVELEYLGAESVRLSMNVREGYSF